jgi:toxin ParE1/3/4
VKLKPVIPREQAHRDVEEALSHDLSEEATNAALGMIDALEKAYSPMGRYPETGLPHFAHDLNLPSLRAWQLKRYPYVVFYMEQTDHIDVWRVLHERRDVPAWLQDSSD